MKSRKSKLVSHFLLIFPFGFIKFLVKIEIKRDDKRIIFYHTLPKLKLLRAKSKVDKRRFYTTVKQEEDGNFVTCVVLSGEGICIVAHSNIEITKDYHLVTCKISLETAAELRAELIFSAGSARSVGANTLKSVTYH